MCVAIPAQIVELLEDDNAVVEVGGVRKNISLSLVEGCVVGDYVIVHVGFALSRLDPEEAQKSLDLFAEMGALAEAEAAGA